MNLGEDKSCLARRAFEPFYQGGSIIWIKRDSYPTISVDDQMLFNDFGRIQITFEAASFVRIRIESKGA